MSGVAPGVGLGGRIDGSFFRAPKWINLQITPGTTKQTPPAWATWLFNLVTGRLLVYTPNLVWFSITCAVYFLFPYDYAAAAALDPRWILRRTVLNLTVLLAYYSFWELSLYHWGWSTRKFRGQWWKGEWLNQNWPTFERVGTNMAYSLLGGLQHTAWEVFFVHLYATGGLPHITDADAFASTADVVRMVAWAFVIPIWRGCHFYFSHRFLHIRFIYKFVHSLHHRNTDIEPFAGLSMHPIEHLYYYACLAPSLWFRCSPFHMLFNLMHLTLSPAASHSGWEDHWQSDQFHYIHHVKFECNYGSASIPMDNVFGTFRECLGESKRYRGVAEGSGGAPTLDGGRAPSVYRPPPAPDGAAAGEPAERPQRTYEGLPTKGPRGFALYMAFSAAAFALAVVAAAEHVHGGGCAAVGLPAGCLAGVPPEAVAAAVAAGPVAVALFLTIATGDHFKLVWPFHKEPLVGQLGLHLVVGAAFTVLPVYQLLAAVLGGSPGGRLGVLL